MSKLKKGLFGGLSGKIGKLVFGTWKGISYLRSLPVSYNNPKTPAQLRQRSIFTITMDFLRPLKDFVKFSYRESAVNMTEFNKAMSWNMKNAFSGEGTNVQFDYAAARVSHGDLTTAKNPMIESLSGNTVKVTWVDNSGEGSAGKSDRLLLLAYNAVKKQATWITHGIYRATGQAEIQLPDDYAGDTIHLYLAFARPDYSSSSNSSYLGSISV